LSFGTLASSVARRFFSERSCSQRAVTSRTIATGCVQREVTLSNTPGPEPVDEHSVAVPAGGWLIRTLDLDRDALLERAAIEPGGITW
jgi:hypothetical protein